jgi:hypothetical protein
VPVLQQGPGQHREAVVQQGEDEQLVPEDVAPVGLSVQPPGGDAHVEVDRVVRDGLDQVKDVQAEDQLGPLRPLDPDVEALPQVIPGQHVSLE